MRKLAIFGIVFVGLSLAKPELLSVWEEFKTGVQKREVNGPARRSSSGSTGLSRSMVKDASDLRFTTDCADEIQIYCAHTTTELSAKECLDTVKRDLSDHCARHI